MPEVPTMRTRSAPCMTADARASASSGSISPNQTTSGRSNAPHSQRGGSAANGSGAARTRCSRTQRTRKWLPCSSTTSSEPARACSASTFCVTTTASESAATARCAAFGSAARTRPRRISYHSHTMAGSRANASGVASSSARKLRHNPPSPRNVGMPLSAETPAPVKTTTLRGRSARIAAAASPIVLTRRSVRLHRAKCAKHYRPWSHGRRSRVGGWRSSSGRRLRRRNVGVVDLDEGVLAQPVDVRLVIALPRLVAHVLAQLLLEGLESRDFGGEALLDLDDVPGGLRFDRADDLAGRGVEHGLVELGEELAARDFAEVPAFVLRGRLGGGLGEEREVGAAAGLLRQLLGVLPRRGDLRRVVRTQHDDLAQMRALGKAVMLLLAVVALAELLVGQILARPQLAREQLVRQDRVAHAPFHLGAGHVRLLQRLIELLIGGDADLLLDALDRVLDLVAGDGDVQAVGAVLEKKLGDDVVDEVLLERGLLRGLIRRRHGLLDFVVALGQALEVLRARDDAVADADDDGLEELRGACRSGDGRNDKCEKDFLHIGFDAEPPPAVLYSFSFFGSVPE